MVSKTRKQIVYHLSTALSTDCCSVLWPKPTVVRQGADSIFWQLFFAISEKYPWNVSVYVHVLARVSKIRSGVVVFWFETLQEQHCRCFSKTVSGMYKNIFQRYIVRMGKTLLAKASLILGLNCKQLQFKPLEFASLQCHPDSIRAMGLFLEAPGNLTGPNSDLKLKSQEK